MQRDTTKLVQRPGQVAYDVLCAWYYVNYETRPIVDMFCSVTELLATESKEAHSRDLIKIYYQHCHCN